MQGEYNESQRRNRKVPSKAKGKAILFFEIYNDRILK